MRGSTKHIVMLSCGVLCISTAIGAPEFWYYGFGEVRGSTFEHQDRTHYAFTELIRTDLYVSLSDRILFSATVEGGFTHDRIRDLSHASAMRTETGSFLELERLFMDAYLPWVDLRIGKQAVHWGSAFLVNPTDPFPELGEDLVRTDGKISHISLLLERRADADAAAQQLQDILGSSVQTTTWEIEAAPGLEAQDLRQRFLDILVVALLVMAAAGIANTVLMAAYERIREVGTLRAMGLTRRGVAGLFMAEGFVMGLMGSVIGALLGGWLTFKYSVQGIDMTGLVEEIGTGEMFQDIPFSSMLYFDFSYRTICLAVAVGILVATVSSFYPAMIAARQAPADAVRS